MPLVNFIQFMSSPLNHKIESLGQSPSYIKLKTFLNFPPYLEGNERVTCTWLMQPSRVG